MTNYADVAPDYSQYGEPTAQVSAQNPTLIPNVDPLLVFASGSAGFVSPAQYLTLYPRQNGSATVTFTGSVTAGDTCSIDLVNGTLPNGHILLSVIATSSDSLTTLAEKLLDLANINPTFQSLGVTAELSIVSSNPVLTFYWPGPVSQFTQLEAQSFVNAATATIATGSSPTAGDVDTLTFTSSNFPATTGQFALGGTATSGNKVAVTFSNPGLPNGSVTLTHTVGSETLASVAAALVTLINANASLTAIGVTASSNLQTVSFAWNAGFGFVQASVAATATATDTVQLAYSQPSQPSALAPTPQGAETITIGGSPTTGEIIQLVISTQQGQNHAYVNYTVTSGDTTPTLVATHLAAAINASVPLQAGQFSATSVGAVVTVTWSNTVGATGWTANVFAPVTETFTTQQPVSSLALAYTVQSGDSTTNIATGLKNAINGDVIANQAGILATSSTNVVTMSYNGALNALGIAGTVSSGGTETITIARTSGDQTVTVGGTIIVGDRLSIKFTDFDVTNEPAIIYYETITADTTTTAAAGLAAAINADVYLADAGITATSSGAVVTIKTAGGDFTPTITTFVNGQPIVTLSGTVTTGDYINVKVINATLAGGSKNVQYQVQATDTTLTILAASVAAAITATASLSALGISATSALGVISLVFPATIGAVTASAAVNGTETATISGTPTNGEMPSITFTDANITGSPVTVSYTEVVPSDTNSSIAAGLALNINNTAAVHAAGIVATAVGAVISLTSTSSNNTAYSETNSTHTTITLAGGPTETATESGAATETLTEADVRDGSEVLTATTPFVGGSGPVIPTRNFVMTEHTADNAAGTGSTQDYWINKPYLVDYDTLQTMVQNGLPVK